MKKYIVYAALAAPVFLLIYISTQSQTNLSSFSTVAINNYSDRLWDETTSIFMVSSDERFTVATTPFQSILSSKKYDNNRHAVILAAGKNKDFNKLPTDNDIKDTRLLQISHPLIANHAQNISLSANPILAAENLVYKIIETKTEGIPIIPAPALFELKKGDCTEHAILSIAFLRALKIPARAVVGLILSREYAGKKNIMVFHMWAEAHYENKWILVDATRPGAKKTNHYIALAYHSLETEMPLHFLEAMASIQNFRIMYFSE